MSKNPVKLITPQNKAEVFSLAEGLPRQQAQRLAAQYLPTVKATRETVRAKRVVVEAGTPPQERFDSTSNAKVTVEERFSVTLEVDQEFMELLAEAQIYAGEKQRSLVIKKALKIYVEKKRAKTEDKAVAKKQPSQADQQKAESRVLKSSRYIPRKVKDAVRIRDEHRCSFVSTHGKRCTERLKLEFDHKIPFYRGGESSVENLRLLCKAHNQLEAEKYYGKEFMDQKRRLKCS